MAFGKRTTQGSAAAPQPPSGHTEIQGFPWSNDTAFPSCNFAFGHLVRNLGPRLSVDGRLHAETYLAGAGAVAGFAAQQSLFDLVPPVMGKTINVLTTKAGANYWFGDNLNFMLVSNGQADEEKLWGNAAGAALQAGLPRERLPKLDDMFKHVAGSIGSEHEGWPSCAASHRPHAPVLFLLQVLWPLAEACLTGSISDVIPAHLKVAPKRWWRAITAISAAQTIVEVKDVLPPDVALTILMESAIHASKLHETVVRKSPQAA